MHDRARVVLYFVVTFLVTWACQAPAILVLRAGLEPPTLVMLMMAVGCAGPSLTALGFRIVGPRVAAEKRAVRPRWLWQLSLFALFFPAAAHLAGSAALYGMGLYSAEHLIYPPLRPEQIMIAILAPLGEEYGFRGYALPLLQRRMSSLAASLWIGLAWAAWHIPTFLVPDARGVSSLELVLYLVAFLASSVVYTWLYNAGGSRMRGPLLAHLGIHLDNVFRASTLGDGVLPLASTSVMLVVFAIVLVRRGDFEPSHPGQGVVVSSVVPLRRSLGT